MTRRKGIHGNGYCVRCGACCVFYEIREEFIPEDEIVHIEVLPTRVWKKAREPCPNLSYDASTRQASCNIHEQERPKVCLNFGCYKGDALFVEGELLEAARRIPEIFASKSER